MHFTAVSLAFFAALGAAQNSTSLTGLVSQLPDCAAGCLPDAAEAAGCGETDLTCICGTGKSKFISSISGCALTACDSDDLSSASTLATSICNAASTANTSELASASAVITSAVGTATATASATSTPGAAVPVRPEHGIGLAGVAAALAALAI
ncbi:hypothetical protein F5Y15DRAFT_68776 [Xylariaceae sp. FL0016]|nr:hypothetical protein F5Y15DRAFT_68776 [Xylariaceae sp. FL0016]